MKYILLLITITLPLLIFSQESGILKSDENTKLSYSIKKLNYTNSCVNFFNKDEKIKINLWEVTLILQNTSNNTINFDHGSINVSPHFQPSCNGIFSQQYGRPHHSAGQIYLGRPNNGRLQPNGMHTIRKYYYLNSKETPKMIRWEWQGYKVIENKTKSYDNPFVTKNTEQKKKTSAKTKDSKKEEQIVEEKNKKWSPKINDATGKKDVKFKANAYTPQKKQAPVKPKPKKIIVQKPVAFKKINLETTPSVKKKTFKEVHESHVAKNNARVEKYQEEKALKEQLRKDEIKRIQEIKNQRIQTEIRKKEEEYKRKQEERERKEEERLAKNKKNQEINFKTESQISDGDFLGAANTYASAGRKTEAYAAAGGHVALQFASVIQNIGEAKLKKVSNKLSNNLEIHDQKTSELIKYLEKNEVTKFLELNSFLLELEKDILRDADWLAYRKSEFFKLMNEIFEKRLYRVNLALKINTKRIIVEPKNSGFVNKLIDVNSEELNYQIPYYKNRKLYKTFPEDIAGKFRKLINDEQITRTKFLLELNKKDNIFNKETEMLIYLTSNLEDEEFEKRSVEIYKNLPKPKKLFALYYAINYGMPDGNVFYNNKSKGGYKYLTKTSLNYNKIQILIKNNKDFNYYINMKNYDGDNIPFYLFLKKNSGFKITKRYSSHNTQHCTFDKGKSLYNYIYEKVKNDMLNFSLTEDTLFQKYQDCTTLNCNEKI